MYQLIAVQFFPKTTPKATYWGFEAEIQNMKAHGARMIDESPRLGAHGAKVAFIHPKSSKGVLTELSQKNSNL
jgi:hypothetical protein